MTLAHRAAAEQDVAVGDVDHAVDHPHGGGLAASRRGPTRTQMSPAGTSRGVSTAGRWHLRNAWSRRGTRGAPRGMRTAPRTGRVRCGHRGSLGGGGGELSTSTQTGRSASLRMRRVLQRVVERLRPRAGATGDEPVGEPRVLGQQRAVQDVPITPSRTTPSKPTPPVLPCPRKTLPSGRSPDRGGCGRRGPRSRPGRVGPRRAPPRWRRCRSRRCRVHADRPAGRRARARDLLVAELVGVAEKLEAAADPRTSPPPSAAACSASRLVSTRSCAHSAWSRS